jgi:hypothetical protein
MLTETIEQPPSLAAAAQAVQSDAKRGNVTLHDTATALLQREKARAGKAAPAEGVTQTEAKADEKAAKPSAAEETPKESKTEPEPKKDADKKAPTEAEDDVLSKLSPDTQESINKRIGKEIAKRTALEAELNALKARMAEVEQKPTPPPEPTPDAPLANIRDFAELDKHEALARETKLWVQQQLRRKDIANGVKVGDRTYSEDELLGSLSNLEKTLDIEVPKHRKFLADRAGFAQKAVEEFDWLKDNTSEHFRQFQAVMRANPELQRRPNGIYIAAAAVEGETAKNLRRAIKEQSQGTVPVKEKAPASQLAASGATAPVREAASSRAVEALKAEMEKMKKKGGISVRDAKDYLLRSLTTHR